MFRHGETRRAAIQTTFIGGPGDVGKTAYYRAHWETTGGIKGPWVMSSAKVP
jgi:hypothetical protein